MKPWHAEVIEWNEGNESELADHRISPSEVEELFQSDPEWVPNKKHRSGDWKMVGYTAGGRAITVVVSFNEARASLRPITGWECTPGDKTRYLGGRK
jgi:uncharacterized DUF497 family protein